MGDSRLKGTIFPCFVSMRSSIMEPYSFFFFFHDVYLRLSCSNCYSFFFVCLLFQVDYEEAIFLWRIDKKDFLLWVITAIATLFLGIEIGVLIGVRIYNLIWTIVLLFTWVFTDFLCAQIYYGNCFVLAFNSNGFVVLTYLMLFDASFLFSKSILKRMWFNVKFIS